LVSLKKDTVDGHECEDLGGSECVEHTVTFDLAIGEVCGVCGVVLLGIEDMWVHDVRSSCSS
jgi:hypothetical protein